MTNSNSFKFYNEYHLNPINKMFHLIGIPLIILSVINFSNYFSLVFNYNNINHSLSLKRLLITYYQIYYLSYGIFPGFVMIVYFELLNIINNSLNLSFRNTAIIFTLSWILQFIGHYIEGRKPAILDSISQSLLGAPIFSLVPLIPSLKKYLL